MCVAPMQVHPICWQTETVVDRGQPSMARVAASASRTSAESRIAEGALETGRAARHDSHTHLLPAQNICEMNSGRPRRPQDCDTSPREVRGNFDDLVENRPEF